MTSTISRLLPAASSPASSSEMRTQFGAAADDIEAMGWIVADPVEVDDAASGDLNRAAIQAQIDAASTAGGGTVRLQAGTYYLRDAATPLGYCIEMKSNVRLIGAGMNATILKMVTAETRTVSVIANTGTITNAELAHFSIDGTKTRLATSSWGVSENEGIDLSSCTDCSIHHVDLFNVAGDGIDLDDATDCVVSECFIRDSGGAGIHTGGTPKRVAVANNFTSGNAYYRVQNGATDGVKRSAAGIAILGNYNIVTGNISVNDERGIVLVSNIRTVVVGNVVYQPGAGSNITSATEADPSTYTYDNVGGENGGVAPNGWGQGIWVHQCLQCTVACNNIEIRSAMPASGENGAIRISGNTSARTIIANNQTISGAVRLTGTDTAVVTGNIISTTQRYAAILISENTGEILVEGNFIEAGLAGVRMEDDAADVNVEGNYIARVSSEGINVIGAITRINIIGNTVKDGSQWGIRVRNIGGTPTNIVVRRNILSGNTSGQIEDNGTATVIRDNDGYVTENWGSTGAIATAATVAHGLDLTPTTVNVTPKTSTPTDVYVTVDATNITVNYTGGGTNDFWWEARV